MLRRTTRTRRRRGKVEKKWCKRKKSRPFPPSRREVSPSFPGDRRGNSSRRDNGGGVHVSCRDSGVDGGSDGGSNGGRGGLGDRGGFGGSPGPVQGGVGPALV